MRIKTALLFLFIIFALFGVGTVSAQDLSNGTAIGIPLAEKNVPNGSIISSTTDGYKLTNSPYDSQIFGVTSNEPALYIKDTQEPNNIPVISNGTVQVRVSSLNGTIKEGDYVTSSEVPGVGQKATENGYVIGVATEAYTNKNTKQEGVIMVTLHPHFAKLTNDLTKNVFSAASIGMDAALSTPLGVIRYAVAGIITLSAFFFGFRFFGRASNRGVEAIGRNPLAKQAILFSVLINTIITIAIMILGVAISYLILVL